MVCSQARKDWLQGLHALPANCTPTNVAHACRLSARRYTGKALFGLMSEMQAAPEEWKGRKVCDLQGEMAGCLPE